jgi:hypothetical protein
MAGIGLHDAWLTYACRRGATTEIDDFEKICALDADRVYCRDWPRPDAPEPLPASDNIPGYRLDYIFIERPTNQHAVDVDLGRIRRRPFWRGGQHPRSSFRTNGTPNFLSDHLGLEVTLLVSPTGGAS